MERYFFIGESQGRERYLRTNIIHQTFSERHTQTSTIFFGNREFEYRSSPLRGTSVYQGSVLNLSYNRSVKRHVIVKKKSVTRHVTVIVVFGAIVVRKYNRAGVLVTVDHRGKLKSGII